MLGAFSEAVARLDPGSFDGIIAQQAGGDASLFALIKGVIAAESSWNIGALRYEPRLNDSSVGLMQVLVNTARQVTGNASLTTSDLFVPDLNIAVGSAYLKYQRQRYGNDKDAASAYNCGSSCWRTNAANAAYADAVLTYQSYYLNQMAAAPAPSTAPTDVTAPTDTTTDVTPTDLTGGLGLDTGSMMAMGALILLGLAAMLLLPRRP